MVSNERESKNGEKGIKENIRDNNRKRETKRGTIIVIKEYWQ